MIKEPYRNMPSADGQRRLVRAVETKAARKLEARRTISRNIWFGFGMSGLVGWSVAAPTLLGAALGRWLDEKYPGVHSWTLTLLLVGLIMGCMVAWHWVARENGIIKSKTEPPDA